MKKIALYTLILVLASSCSNKPSVENESTTTETTTTATDDGSNTISEEQITNPATADNPTAAPTEFAIMNFKNTEHNFGDILENQKVETTYEFTNTGKVDLLINDCQAACGCTVPEWPKTPIKPGGSGKIKVVFDSAGKSGVNNKNVTVFANIKDQKIVLNFTANVRAVKQKEQK